MVVCSPFCGNNSLKRKEIQQDFIKFIYCCRWPSFTPFQNKSVLCLSKFMIRICGSEWPIARTGYVYQVLNSYIIICNFLCLVASGELNKQKSDNFANYREGKPQVPKCRSQCHFKHLRVSFLVSICCFRKADMFYRSWVILDSTIRSLDTQGILNVTRDLCLANCINPGFPQNSF